MVSQRLYDMKVFGRINDQTFMLEPDENTAECSHTAHTEHGNTATATVTICLWW